MFDVLPSYLKSIMKRMLTVLMLGISLFVPAHASQNVDGTWEGEIQDPKRPIVLTVDFKALSVSLSGAAPIKLTTAAVSKDTNTVTFEFTINGQTLIFSGTRKGKRIAGDVNTGSNRIPFWLELLPARPKPANRVEAWQQDIDAVLSRFLRY